MSTGNVTVVKVGGELLDDEVLTQEFANGIAALIAGGRQVVICHGGGPQISRAMDLAGKHPKFSNGLRVTDAETMLITQHVLLGEINCSLVAGLCGLGLEAVGVSGIDDTLVVARIADPKLGYVGQVEAIEPTLLFTLLEGDFVPVIAPLGRDPNGTVVNINADHVAGAVAAAVQADEFIVMTNVDGLFGDVGDSSSLIDQIDLTGIRELLTSERVSAGMVPKIEGIVTALEGGVQRAFIVNGRSAKQVTRDIVENRMVGTQIVANLM